MRIAVILTAYNRRRKTLECIAALNRQTIGRRVSLEVFLTDDASTDGTQEAVRSTFPEVTILQGTGNLFWGGGMRLAFGEALRRNFDAYIWLNDDTVLFPDAVTRLTRTLTELRERREDKVIVVGTTCDPITHRLTYGGVVRNSSYHPLKFRLVAAGDVPVRCDTFNGNCVLITRHVAGILGNISSGFTQAMGDFDYGLRAARMGCSMWVAPGVIGHCARNPSRGSWEDSSLTLSDRWKLVRGPKGLPPSEYRRYASRHAGRMWPLYWAAPYVRLMLSGILSSEVRPK